MSGTAKITYYPFESLDKNIIKKYPDCFTLVGDYDDMVAMKKELIEKYGGCYPKSRDAGIYDDVRGVFYTVWGAIALLILFFYYFEFSIQKKEMFVKVTLGEKIELIILKGIMNDVFLVLCFSVCSIVINYILSDTLFFVKEVVEVIAAICIMIGFMYLSLLNMKVAYVLSNQILSRKGILLNYCVKLISFVLMIIMATISISAFFNWNDFNKQKDLFQMYKGYKYFSVYHDSEKCEHDTLENEAGMEAYIEAKLYEKYLNKGNITYVDMLSEGEVIYANCNLKKYLQRKIPEFINIKENTVYLLVPEGTKLSDEEKEEYINTIALDIGETEFQVEEFRYTSEIKLTTLSTDNQLGSVQIKNPIVVFSNVKNVRFPENEMEYLGQAGRLYMAFANVSEDKINEIISKYAPCIGYKCVVTDVWEEYESNNIMLKRVAMITMILFGICGGLVVLMNQMLIRMLYIGNGIELAIKKIMGYTITQRYKWIFISDILVGGIAIGISLFFYNDYKEKIMIFLFGLLVIGINCIQLICVSKRQDKYRISEILKGGIK